VRSHVCSSLQCSGFPNFRRNGARIYVARVFPPVLISDSVHLVRQSGGKRKIAVSHGWQINNYRRAKFNRKRARSRGILDEVVRDRKGSRQGPRTLASVEFTEKLDSTSEDSSSLSCNANGSDAACTHCVKANSLVRVSRYKRYSRYTCSSIPAALLKLCRYARHGKIRRRILYARSREPSETRSRR